MLTFRFANTKTSDSFGFELSGVTFVSNMSYCDLSGRLLRSVYLVLYGLVNFESVTEDAFLDLPRSKLSDCKSLGPSPISEIIKMCNGFSMQKTPNHLRSYLKDIFGVRSYNNLGALSLMEVYEDGKQVYGPDRTSFLDFDSVDDVIYIDDSDEISDELHEKLTCFGKCDRDVRCLCLCQMICGQLFGSVEYNGVSRSFSESKREFLSDSFCKVYMTLLQLLKKMQLDDRTVLIIDRKSAGMVNSRHEDKFHDILLAIHSLTGTKILCSKIESH